MILRILVFALLLLSFGNSKGQRLHAFLFCKTLDKDIGRSAGINFMNMKDRLQQISQALNIGYEEHSVTGSAFKVNAIASELSNAKIGTNDIVVLYFSTHGGMSAKNPTTFPSLDIPDSLVSAYTRHQLLMKKKPKIIMTIIEACSGYFELSPQQAFLFEQSIIDKRDETFNQRQIDNVKILFSEPFKLIITAGEAGKNTYATDQGSIFTTCFLDAMHEYIDLPRFRVAKELNWTNILEQARNQTYDRTTNFPINYQPVWETVEYNGIVAQGILNAQPAEKRDVKFVVKTRKTKWFFQNPYAVELTIENSSPYYIDSVVYYLHKTMPRPVVMSNMASRKFIHSFTVWGRFPLKAKVYFCDGKNFEYFQDFHLKESS